MLARILILAAVLLACDPAVTAPGFPTDGVVFLGDSITDQLGADLTRWFGPEAAGWINAGVGGERSDQVLARVDSAVDPATARTCVLLVGINDILEGAGDGGGSPDLVGDGTAGNNHASVSQYIARIVDDLSGRGVRTVLGTVLPVSTAYPNAATINPKVATLDAWLRSYAAQNGLVVADYYRAFVRPDGSGNPALYADGLHPNPAGQRVLTDVAAAALRRR